MNKIKVFFMTIWIFFELIGTAVRGKMQGKVYDNTITFFNLLGTLHLMVLFGKFFVVLIPIIFVSYLV